MREILFRGKRFDNGEWVEGYLLKECNYATCSWNLGIEYKTDRFGRFAYEVAEVVPYTVGQFTGLTDKNGKKIFEGDRCRVSRPCVLAYGKITFQNGCFWFVDDGPGGMLRLCDVKMNGFEIEVIGNIHDNPKLLRRDGNA